MTSETARAAFQSLIEGSPNGATAETLGPWWDTYEQLKGTHDLLGYQAMIESFNLITRSQKGFARLLAGSLMQTQPTAIPALPPNIAALFDHAAPCGAWLDDYIRFAVHAAPMTPRAFHEAAGLFLVSTAIARRLVSVSGLGTTYPNLFILQIAPPAVYKKTTGLNVAGRVLDAAGLSHLLIPQTITPQALIEELGTTITEKIRAYDEETRALWLLERSFAAQRAWRIDEAGQLFDSFEREYNAGLHQLILQLYDCEDTISAQTNSRGKTIVKRASLSFLGATTPESIRKHLTNKMLWGTGLWSRFCVIAPDSPPVYAPRPPKTPIPVALIAGLRRIFELFPVPRAEWDQDEDENGKHKTPRVQLYNIVEPIEVIMGAGVDQAIDLYSEHVGFHMARKKSVEPLFHSAYDRLSVHLTKVAMILAVMDSPTRQVTIEMRHIARALDIVERWRAALHQVYGDIAATDEAILTSRIFDLMTKERGGFTARELAQRLHKPSSEIKQALTLLQEAGQVDAIQTGRKTVWAVVDSVASVANRSNGSATHFEALQSNKVDV